MTKKPEPQEYEHLSKEELVGRLRALQSDPRLQGPMPELQRMVHELQVHQVELAMQNRELRETQAQLLETNARYSDLYDFAPVAYCTLDEEDRIKEANLTAAALFGVERRAMLGRRLSSLVPPQMRKRLREHLKRCFAAGEDGTLDATVAVRSGEPVTVQLVSKPVLDRAGKVIACRATLTDISALKRSEQMLGFLARASAVLASALRDSDAIGQVADLLVPAFADVCLVEVVASDSSIRRVQTAVGGPRAADLGGAQLPSALHQRVFQARRPVFVADAVADGGNPDLKLDPLLAGATSVICVPSVSRGRSLGVLTLAMTTSGRRYVSTDLAFVQDLASRIAAAVESAALYQDAQRAVQAREETLAVVSHDLRTPASAILLATKALEESTPPSDPVASRLLQSIQRSTERMNRMIDDLLDLSSIDAGHLALERRDCQVDGLLEDACENLTSMAREKGLGLEADHLDRGLRVSCDRERVLQVFSNLVGNAIKFTPRGGSISLAAQADEGFVRFTVRDTGPGIDRATVPHLFERYSQAVATARRGRGLGLYICKGIIEAHGGRIWAETGPRRGTSILFTLPRGAPAREAASPRARRRNGTLLVVDDDQQHREGLRAVLMAGGYSVEEAEDGIEALEKVRAGAALPSLILLDLQMPRMDGWGVMTELKKDPLLASIPVILVSGYSRLGVEAEALGAQGYVGKPVRTERLLEEIDRCRAPGRAGATRS